MVEHAAAWGWTFPYLVDADQTAALAYGAACTPDFFLRRRPPAGLPRPLRRFDAGQQRAAHRRRARCSGQCVAGGQPISTDQRRASAAASSGSPATNRADEGLERTGGVLRGQCGAEECPQFVAEVTQGDDARRPSDGTECFGIGGDPRDRRRHEHGDQPWVTSSKATTFRRRSSRRLDRPAAAGGDAALRHAPRAAGSARGRVRATTASARLPEHGADDRVDAVEWLVRRRPNRRLDCHGELRGGLDVHGVDELVLAGKPVQHRLLAHPDGGGDLIQRNGVDAVFRTARRTPRESSSSSAQGGMPLVYHLVENHARPVVRDRRVARRQTRRHHGAGFVGTALVERLLRCVPDCNLVLPVRDGKRTTAAQRRAGTAQE